VLSIILLGITGYFGYKIQTQPGQNILTRWSQKLSCYGCGV